MSTRQRTPLRVRDSVLPSFPDEPPPALTMTTALAIQRLPLSAKRNGAWVDRQSSAHRNPHNPQEQGQPTNRATRKRKQKRTENAPFRLIILPYRKLINVQWTMCNVQNGGPDFIKLTDTNPVSPSILNWKNHLFVTADGLNTWNQASVKRNLRLAKVKNQRNPEPEF